MSVNAHHRRRESPPAKQRWLLVAAYFSALSAILLLPNPFGLLRELGRSAPSWDLATITTIGYFVHFGGFGLLVLLLIWASPKRGPALYVWPVLAAALYGALVEVIQIPIPNRTFDVFDIAADAAGGAIAAALYLLLRRRARGALPH